MNTDSNTLPLCANCGKGEEESTSLKKCGACKMVNYCSAACQKAHRPQHKMECKKRAAELHDEKLFKQPPQFEDCPICFLRLPSLQSGRMHQPCCGKIICSGCIHAVEMTSDENVCPFCRTLAPDSDEEALQMNKQLLEVGDAVATHNQACYYYDGKSGLAQDRDKALELWHRAGELGCFGSYYNIGNIYFYGRDVNKNEKKAVHYWELSAMGGDVNIARYNLGIFEMKAGNMERAIKHFAIAVRSGSNESLKKIKQLYSKGYAAKNDYAKALQAYQSYLSEIKSDDRDEAAAYSDEYKYYGEQLQSSW